MEADEKKCPQCAETVKAEAKICRFCGHSFGASDALPVAAPPVKKANPLAVGCLVLLGLVVLLYVIGSNAGSDIQSDASIDGLASAAADAAPEDPIVASLTGPQANARRSAEQYLRMSGFSREGLINQLSSDAGEGYEVADATAAVDSLTVDWNEQAARSAEQYLRMTGFSCTGLIQQLSSDAGERYTQGQARFGAQQAGAC